MNGCFRAAGVAARPPLGAQKRGTPLVRAAHRRKSRGGSVVITSLPVRRSTLLSSNWNALSGSLAVVWIFPQSP